MANQATHPQAVLVFPAGMPAALKWARRAMESGVRVIGASSLSHDPSRAEYTEWTSLPWSGDPDFGPALQRTLREQGISSIFTSHPVVTVRLRQLLPELAPDVALAQADAWAADLADYRLYREIAARWVSDPLQLITEIPAAPAMSPLLLSALLRQFYTIPGECDHQKLEALAAVFRLVPHGDIVEIGSLWGRSAAALAFLSSHYGIGTLLCVDPWRSDALPQGIKEVDSSFGKIAIEEVFDAFRTNLAPFAGLVNYLRACSAEAALAYGATYRVETEDFGSTAYTGRIALLHIDGNHALQAVRNDIAIWRQWVQPGGWIVFDDYSWSFGDGPKIAADEFCWEFRTRLTGGFVAGGALFVQVAADVDAASPLA